jgi:hypothetical protein
MPLAVFTAGGIFFLLYEEKCVFLQSHSGEKSRSKRLKHLLLFRVKPKMRRKHLIGITTPLK